MKVALVHDYIKEYGGAERVLETLHDMFPDAPVFTTVYCPTFLGPHKQRFDTWDIRPSWLQRIPWKEKLISPMRLIAPWVFSRMDFSSFDLVLVSATGAYEPNMIQKGTATHLCYCHTPPRYLYGYATARNWKKNPLVRWCAEGVNTVLRMVDNKSSRHVDLFIANSKEVASRIEKFYGRSSRVVYPPVDAPLTTSPVKKEAYFIAGGRLAQAKHINLAIEACTELHLPLKVFGKSFAGYGKQLQMIAGSTIEFLGEISDEKKWDLLAKARAFIFPSEDEDFGILPVEAMAVGTPVIAHASGGVKETVIDGKTGIFFNHLTCDSVRDALVRFQQQPYTWTQPCKKQGRMFSKTKFCSEIQKVITLTMREKNQKSAV